MNKKLLALTIVLALLSCVLLTVILVQKSGTGPAGNSGFFTQPQDISNGGQAAEDPTDETQESAAPAGPLGEDFESDWDLPEF